MVVSFIRSPVAQRPTRVSLTFIYHRETSTLLYLYFPSPWFLSFFFLFFFFWFHISLCTTEKVVMIPASKTFGETNSVTFISPCKCVTRIHAKFHNPTNIVVKCVSMRFDTMWKRIDRDILSSIWQREDIRLPGLFPQYYHKRLVFLRIRPRPRSRRLHRLILLFPRRSRARRYLSQGCQANQNWKRSRTGLLANYEANNEIERVFPFIIFNAKKFVSTFISRT